MKIPVIPITSVEKPQKGRGAEMRKFYLVFLSIIYLVLNEADYYLTVGGIKNDAQMEQNFLARMYIEFLGPHQGLFLFKVIFCLSVIFFSLCLEWALRKGKIKRFKAEYLLLGGITLTLGAILRWAQVYLFVGV